MFTHWLGIYITNYAFLYIKYEEGFQELFCCFEKIHLVIYALLLLLCCCCFFFFIHLESWKATRSMNITGTDMTYSDKDMSACNKECLPWARCVKFDCWTWMVLHCWLCSIFFFFIFFDSLPFSVRHAQTFPAFKSHLQTHLFFCLLTVS